jgi:heavy metal efflux system protein
MFNAIIETAIKQRYLVFLITGIMAVIGFQSYKSLPIDAVPDITNIQVQINAQVGALTPEEIERNITFPLESAMGGIEGVTGFRSITRFGLSQVTVNFQDGTDIYRARQLVSERLQVVELPEGVRPTLGPVSTGLGEIYHYAVEAKEIAVGEKRISQLMELRAVQDFVIKPRLMTVEGLAEVNTIGGHEKQFFIKPNPKKMSDLGIHFDEIVSSLKESNRNVGGGYIQESAEQFLVQGIGVFTSVQDLRNLSVKSLENFRVVRLGDIAEIGPSKSLRTGAALVDGQEAVLGTAFMRMGENSRTVSIRVKDKLHEIEKALPEWAKLEHLYDRSDLVNRTISTVQHNLVFGAALVVVVLLLLIGNARAALVTAAVIPLSLLFTFILMKMRGVSGNLMSLGALDFGIIIDGAVIVIDNCARVVAKRSKDLGRKLTREEVVSAVRDATFEVRQAAGFGELIIVVVFLPIFALTGIEGKMFGPMAATFCFALLGAFLMSFTVAPALAATFLSGNPSQKTPAVMRFFENLYNRIFGQLLQKRKLVISSGIASIFLGVFLFSRLGGEFIPQLDEGSIAIQFVRPVNVSADNSVRLQELSEEIIKEFPQVERSFSRIGTAEIATDPMGLNLSDTYVMLKDKGLWPKDANINDKEELVAAIVTKLSEELPGQRILVTQPIQMRFNELLEGTRADLSIKIYGEDLDKLNTYAGKIASIVRSVPGAGDVEEDSKGKSPLLAIVPRDEVIARLGASRARVLDTVEVGIGGHEAGYLFEGVRRYPIVVQLNEEDRSNLETLKTLPVGLGQNFTAPLGDLAEISFTESFGAITRENGKRRAAVLVNPRDRDMKSFVTEAQAKVEAEVKMEPGYFVEWGGNFKNLERASERFSVLVPLALILVLLMIYAAFKDPIETALVFLCVPMALVGGVLGLMIWGLPFSISAGVGFVALAGIAVLNGVVLVSFFNQLRIQGMTGVELVRSGTLLRLRPVLMTALVDIFGFLPMLLAQGAGAEVQRPIAAVVVGGMISATLLTLVVLPLLFNTLEKRLGKPIASGH